MLAIALLMSSCASLTYDPSDVFVSDEDLLTEVYHRLQDDFITTKYRFGVTVKAGQVVLRGAIPDMSARQRAINITLGTPGVREVIDKCYP